ncbi:MAG: DUF748 domain-containing protein [Oligoflexales bacterium]
MGKKLALGLLAVLVVGVVLRLALPNMILAFVNHKLSHVGDYSGRVGDLKLDIIDGFYQVFDVNIAKVQGNKELPLLRARSAHFSVDWGHIFDKELVGSVVVRDVHMNIVDSTVEKEKQIAKQTDWEEPVRQIFPFRIDSFELINGTLEFYNSNVTPKIHVIVRNINVDAKNLTNSLRLSDTLISTVKANAVVLGSGKVDVTLRLNPIAENMFFDLNAKAANIDLKKLNAFNRHYLGIDLEKGEADVVVEIACVNNRIQGYIKPIARNLDVADFKEDVQKDDDSLWTYLKELVIGATAEVAENQPKDQLGTRIPIAGTVRKPRTSVWVVLEEIFLNAARRPLGSDVERSVDFDTVRGENKSAH